jgi:hypothetical protein
MLVTRGVTVETGIEIKLVGKDGILGCIFY